MKYKNIPEAQLINEIARDFFGKFDCTEVIKNIDFAVKVKGSALSDGQYLLWAEAKAGSTDIAVMLAQLVLTIGRAKIHNELLPPPFLGCFDRGKMAFIPFSAIQKILYQNDFNWKVTPSDRETREFKLICAQVNKIINSDKKYVFSFEKDEKELKQFINENFISGKGETSKITIDKNNFVTVYAKWLETVKPTILVDDWERAKRDGVLDGDFYLADLLSSDNRTIKENLFIILEKTHYVTGKHKNNLGFLTTSRIDFKDKQRAHTQFWAIYERPPRDELLDYIIDRRDLLVPQDVRERKGSFYTPQIWVELSQRYLAKVFGENWQEEYYVWDCAAGTGNLLVGLTNKYNIWASTLDKADVKVMHDRIENGANLLKDHCFQFDFLNDGFEKLPKGLRDIINDEERRKKLIVYINPPYAEAANYGKSKSGVSLTKVYGNFKEIISFAVSELFSQFFARIYKELPNCKLASFSKLKYITASNFAKFRDFFKAEFLKGFVCHANTFDNVKGNFPIGFLIWNLERKKAITQVKCDVSDNDGKIKGKKKFFSVNKGQVINDWLRNYYDRKNTIGYLRFVGPDFQANVGVYITSEPKESDVKESRIQPITQNNLIEMCVYHAVRHCIPATWLNDRDQFLYPADGWKTDTEFQNDCLAYTLFNNNIRSKPGVNHWIPFAEKEVNAKDKYDSHFMLSFIGGKIIENGYSDLFEQNADKWCAKRKFSSEAAAVFDAGRKLWKYYHKQPECNVNASLYDIREYFQGRNPAGKMNNKSGDEAYNELMDNLRVALKILARKIEPKVYEYGFLKQ